MDTQTGGRIKRICEYIGDETFMLTYGDGVANIHIPSLLKHHQKNQKLATVTAVRPPARFGGIEFDSDLVASFAEKPQIGEGWINGGFFVLEPEIANYISGDEVIWEQRPMELLVERGQLAAYRHYEFWQCVDTLRDLKLLNNLWQTGEAPWKIWG
jgi:glucose-1-phosphate cytidylyltransferase